MCTAVFADGNANVEIKLKNFDNAEKVEYMQIIQKDESTTSGWAFTNGAGACFIEALGMQDSADAQQEVIWGLIKFQDPKVVLPTGVTAKQVTAANIDLALSKVAALTGFKALTDKTKIEVSEAGIYAIKAEEEGYRNHQSDASDACSLCCDRNCDRGDPGCRYQFCSEQKTTQEIVYG